MSDEAISRTIGLHIRNRRIELGLTQDQLALRLGLSYQQLQKYEIGSNRITASRLFRLSQILDVPIGYFFAGACQWVEGGPHAEHGGRRRRSIDLVRGYSEIADEQIRASLTGLVKAVVERQR